MGKLKFDKQSVINGLGKAGFFVDDLATKVVQWRGVARLIEYINDDERWQTIPQVAYFLATVAHECALTKKIGTKNLLVRTFEPIEEIGGNAYFTEHYENNTNVAKRLGNLRNGDGAKFHGRGYVQLTGRNNYAGLGKMLRGTELILADTDSSPATLRATLQDAMTYPNVKPSTNSLVIENDTFVLFPALALIPKVSYEDAVRSMFSGRYTGKKITDYINVNKVAYVEARRVINGTDRAEDIAKLAGTIEGVLRKARDVAQKFEASLRPGTGGTDTPPEPRVTVTVTPGPEIGDETTPAVLIAYRPSPEGPVVEQKPGLAAQETVRATQDTPKTQEEAVTAKLGELATPENAAVAKGVLSKVAPFLKQSVKWVVGTIGAVGGYLQDNPKVMVGLIVGCALIAAAIWYYERKKK